jgi:hypothetical protein
MAQSDPASLPDELHGSALSNDLVRAAVAKDRAVIARAESRIAAMVALLEARVNEDPRAWATPSPGWHPARPEDPAAAAAVLAEIRISDS